MARARVGVEFTPVNTTKVDAALARIQAQAKGVNFGKGAESINKLSRPLGKITGQATEFQKSLEASNARVLAFGASVAVINKLSEAFGALVSNTVKVEATFAKINTILGGTRKELEAFGNGIFKVAQNTATSFDQVAEGALELARQGLGVEESLSRVETALKLVRVAGIDSQQAVAGLTAAIKGFEGAGLTVAQIADKLAEVDTKFAVSTEDLINGLERASASARVAGVSFDELLGVITTVQERTQRGGAVIGNAFKTIFARMGRTDTLAALQDIGISVLDTQGNVRDAIPLFQELATELDKMGLKSVQAGEIIQKVAGVRQRDILINLIEDLNSEQSKFANSLETSASAAGSLDAKNAKLNDTLEALINNLTTGGQKLASIMGEIGFTDAAKDILKAFSSVVTGITDLLQGDSIGSKFAQGIVKGIGGVLTGPGLAIVTAIFSKLFIDLAKFGGKSLQQVLGINKATQAQNSLQQSVLQTLLQNESIQREILALEGNKVAQEQLLLRIYNQQAAALAKVQKTAAAVTPGLFGAGLRGGEKGVVRRGKAADGYIAAEARDVSRGVGGAPSSAKVVSIPNFAFGGGKHGTMVANTSEYYVPNYAGGGDAIFNQDMVRSMGLPAGAKKINAAGGYVPKDVSNYGFLVPQMGVNKPIKPLDASIGGKKTTLTGAIARGIRPNKAKTVSDPIEKRIKEGVIQQTTKYANELQPLGRTVSTADIKSGFGTIAGAKGALQAAIGSAFEVGIVKALDYRAAIREKGGDFDIRGGRNIQRVRELFGLPENVNVADFKVSDSVGNVESFYSKIMKEIGADSIKGNRKEYFKKEARKNAELQAKKQVMNMLGGSGGTYFTEKGEIKRRLDLSTRNRLEKLIESRANTLLRTRYGNYRAARGYIPNFAQSALEDAVGRERAAGLPINQIRINQNGKLRNAQNPMGLAVTNTRDEPTGAIPNFNQGGMINMPMSKGLEKTVEGMIKANKKQTASMEDFSGRLMTTSIALSFLSSAFSGAESGIGKFVSELALAGSMLSGLAMLKGPLDKLSTKLVNFGTSLGRGPGGAVKSGKLAGAGRFVAGAGRALPAIGATVAVAGVVAPLLLELTKTKTGFENLNQQLEGVDLVKLSEGNVEAVRSFRASLQTELDRITGERKIREEVGADPDTSVEKVLEKQLRGIEGLSTGAFGGIKNKESMVAAIAALGGGEEGRKKLQEVVDRTEKNKKTTVVYSSRGSRKKVEDVMDIASFITNLLEATKTEAMTAQEKKAAASDKLTLASRASDLESLKRKGAASGLHLSGDQFLMNPLTKDNQQKVQLAQNTLKANELELKLAGNLSDLERERLEANKALLEFKISQSKASTKLGAQLGSNVVKALEGKAVDKKNYQTLLDSIEAGKSFEEVLQAVLDLKEKGLLDETNTLDEIEKQVKGYQAQNNELRVQDELNQKILNKQQKMSQMSSLQRYSQDVDERLKNQADELPRVLAENLEQSMADTFEKIATGAYDSIGDAFLQIALNFGRELQRQIAQRTAMNLTNAMFGDETAGGGFLGKISKAITGYNSGGMVTGGSGVRDDVPAVLTGGEYVLKKSAVQKYGVDFLERLNSGAIRGMQSGGLYTQTAGGYEGGRFWSDPSGNQIGGAASNERLKRARGMDFFVPGTRGAGEIVGKESLLAFAQQEVTSGKTDVARSTGSGAFVSLEDQSHRLTTFGRFRESPARRALKDAQRQAFGLYTQRVEEEARVVEEKKQAEKARDEQFKQAIIGSFVNAAAAGAGAYFQNLPSSTPQGLKGFMGEPLGEPYKAFGGAYDALSMDQLNSSTLGSLTGSSRNLLTGPLFNRANGGEMSGNTNALLMGGEYVMSAQAASAIGRDTLDSINMMRYENGGAVGNVASSSSGGSSKEGADVGEVNITINMAKDGGATVDATSDGSNPAQSKEFARKVKEVVVNVINEEKRVSGSLFGRGR
jgi:TP901 family phage tail tape measure protein